MKKRNALVITIVFVVSISCNLMGNVPTTIPTITPIPITTPTLNLTTGSIGGILWHEICKFTGGEGGEPLVLGQGCVQWGAAPQEFGPNQLKDNFETGWESVTLHLGSGKCPSIGLATVITNASGEYQFTGLVPGTYCVSYSNLTDKNDAILIPGEPTFPERGDAGFLVTVDLQAAEAKTVNFGYAWQFYN
jgi:hypothetical protein